MASPSTVSIGQCSNCQGARFDDARSGAQEVRLTSGRMGLKFNLNRRDRSILDYKWNLDDSLPHLPKLSATAKAGCEFCQFLIDLLRSQDVTYLFKDVLDTSQPSNEISLRLYCSYTWGNSDFILIDKHGYGGANYGLRSFQLRAHLHNAKSRIDDSLTSAYCIINCLAELSSNAHPGDECSAWLGLRTAPVPLSLSNNEPLTKLRSTLSDCVSQTGRHKACGKPRDPSYLPTRLIEIGDDTQALRLVRSSDIKNQLLPNTALPRYAALSYCWGEMQDASYTLTSQTEATKMSGFGLCDLPKVLQDAIAITKTLSLSYIWIDALCIIQDMGSDWEQESSQMGDIYESAYITICSLTSSSQLSFLQPERTKANISFQSSINANIRGSYSLSYLDSDMDNAGRDPYMYSFPKSRWFSRGWTYQELRFSKRLLLLCPSYSAFMCAGLFNVFGGPNINTPMMPLHNLNHLAKDAHRIYDIWLEFGQRYSGRVLTYPQDALPAISGAAKLFAENLLDDYHAGIWKSDLRGLLWNYPSIPMTPSRDLSQLLTHLSSPDNYVAPSWSWVGHRYISFHVRPAKLSPMIQPQCQHTISTSIDGQNIFGRVKGGRLIVTGPTYDIGPFMPISLIRLENRDLAVLTKQDGEDVSLFLDWRVEETDTEQELVRGNFKLVLIGTYEIIDDGDVTFITTGLITYKAKEEGNFHRVGRFDLSSPNQGIHKLFAAAKIETIRII
ncbi:heterokaryon incompatibility protein-domain-containing protein [Xylaria flabelliformis]|nr:heterokaryon incompatibility protein-domain-containing protein [Xylaria flabelliformis]